LTLASRDELKGAYTSTESNDREGQVAVKIVDVLGEEWFNIAEE